MSPLARRICGTQHDRHLGRAKTAGEHHTSLQARRGWCQGNSTLDCTARAFPVCMLHAPAGSFLMSIRIVLYRSETALSRA
jgi:hypothetical protein